MNRHTRTRIRNRFFHPIAAPFEALWTGIKSLFKGLLNGLHIHHERTPR